MKRSGIYHPGIAQLLASCGHTDCFTICDRGFPVPIGPERIDLALVDGIPLVFDVLRAILPEFALDRVLVAEEALKASPAFVRELRGLLDATPLVTVSHLELKEIAEHGRATIRTADTAQYANIVLVSG